MTSSGIYALLHGDDYATLGPLNNLKWLQGQLESAFEMKTVIAGHGGRPGVVGEVKILNSVIRSEKTPRAHLFRSENAPRAQVFAPRALRALIFSLRKLPRARIFSP